MTLYRHGQYPQTQQTMTEKSSAQLAYVKQLISSAEDEKQATKLLANLASLSLGYILASQGQAYHDHVIEILRQHPIIIPAEN
ncbi:hypothetical protein [Oceanospirillum sediminis]|uniref:Uncharacterized protein n=1 Tax=Oceanospirillum sediminis TaxID=2760088 RepID=A0A839IKE3_9GAMM|nr:hypothetical protein [Oceanospirillum sediminis]MBB1485823.1 hypothetical protein [Oceanospirillum sediminis]